MVKELRNFLPEERPIMILANQYDILQNQMNYTFVNQDGAQINKAMSDVANHSFVKQDTRQIRDIEKYAMFSGGIFHHRTSAKTGQGVEACFNQLISKIWTNINR